MKKICVIFGTRPEIVKLYPIINELKNKSIKRKIITKILYTNQHLDLGNDFTSNFKIKYNSKLKSKKKSSFAIVDEIQDYLYKNNIDAIIVVGDTLSATAGAIAGFLNKSKIFYIESGLRTGDFNQPWPEEGLRKIITHISNFHFAATKENKKILLSEGINKKYIKVLGNPVIDAANQSLKKLLNKSLLKKVDNSLIKILNKKKIPNNFVLLTIHRRENFGDNFEKICDNINKLSKLYPDLKFIYPVHPNPYIKKNAPKYFKSNNNIILIKPVSYYLFLRLMQLSKFIITDSGGIQEESSVLGKYVLLARNKTERPELINKIVFIAGTNYRIYKKLFLLFLKKKASKKYNKTYGTGNSAIKIVKKILEII